MNDFILRYYYYQLFRDIMIADYGCDMVTGYRIVMHLLTFITVNQAPPPVSNISNNTVKIVHLVIQALKLAI
jgi:hypothetical protein